MLNATIARSTRRYRYFRRSGRCTSSAPCWRGRLGFNELGRAVGGCNPATLKVRLDRLEDLGLLRRTVHSQMPPRTSYELAPAGVDLQRVIDAIDAWASGASADVVAGLTATRSCPPLSADRHPGIRRRAALAGVAAARGRVRIDTAAVAERHVQPLARQPRASPRRPPTPASLPPTSRRRRGTIPANYATALAFAPDGRLFWTSAPAPSASGRTAHQVSSRR